MAAAVEKVKPTKEIIEEAKKNFLNIFWKLSDGNIETRTSAVLKIVSYFSITKNSESWNDDLNYALNRFIEGLGSSNAGARLGHFVGLINLLRNFPSDVSVDHVLELINKLTHKDDDTADKSKRFVLCMGYGALIRSHRISNDMELIKKLLSEMITNCKSEKGLSDMYACYSSELISQIGSKSFVTHLWPIIGKHFEGGWECLRADLLKVFAASLKHLPEKTKQTYLLKHFGISSISDDAALSKIVTIMGSSSASFNVHYLVEDLVNIIPNEKLENFWNLIIQGPQNSSSEKKDLPLRLIVKLIPKVEDIALIPVMLSPSIVQLILTELPKPSSPLHSTAEQLIKCLVEVVGTSTNTDKQFEILKCLIVEPGTILFDEKTKTKTIINMLKMLKGEARIKAVELLQTIFYESEANESDKRHGVLRMMSHFIDSNFEPSDVEIIKFLVIHSYFNQISVSSKVPLCNKKLGDVPDIAEIHKIAKECLMKSLLALSKKILTTGNKNLLEFGGYMSQCLKFAVRLLKSAKVATPIVEHETKDFETLISKIEMLESHVKSGNEAPHCAFLALLYHLGFMLFDDPEKISSLEDIYKCHEDAFGKMKKYKTKPVNGESDKQWVKVFVDVLLAVMSEDSQLNRATCKHVFELLQPQLTLDALKHVLEVIDPSSNDVLGEDESMDEDDGDETSDGDVKMDVSEDVSTRKRKLEAESEDEGSNEGEDEVDDEVYLGDEEMFKMDEHLAKAFKTMSGKINKKSDATVEFRIRCLDFIKVVMTNQPKVSLLMPCLLTLANIIKTGMRVKGYKLLASRAWPYLNAFANFKMAHLIAENDLDVSYLPEILKEMIDKLKKTKKAADLCLFVVHCAYKCDQSRKEPQMSTAYVDACLAVYRNWLTEFFTKTKASFYSSLFTSVVRSKFFVGWHLANDLLELSFSENNRLFQKMKGIVLLSSLTSKQVFDRNRVESETWAKFSKRCISDAEKNVVEVFHVVDKRMMAVSLLTLIQNLMKINTLYSLKIDLSSSTVESFEKYLEEEAKSSQIAKEIRKVIDLSKQRVVNTIKELNIDFDSSLDIEKISNGKQMLLLSSPSTLLTLAHVYQSLPASEVLFFNYKRLAHCIRDVKEAFKTSSLLIVSEKSDMSNYLEFLDRMCSFLSVNKTKRMIIVDIEQRCKEILNGISKKHIQNLLGTHTVESYSLKDFTYNSKQELLKNDVSFQDSTVKFKYTDRH